MPPILCCRTHHGRTTDIDIFNRILQATIISGYGLAEWVQIHHHQINRWYQCLLYCRHMLRQVPPRQNASMNFRVESLDPPIEHLWKAGVIADLSHLHAGILQQLGSSASGKYVHAKLFQSKCKLDNAALVGNAN